MGQQFSTVPSDTIWDFSDAEIKDYFILKGAYTGSFMVLLLLLSWWYGPSSFEKRFDPVEAACEERDAAIKERSDAQRAWGEMGTKHERAMERILALQNEFSKAYKDLPWLTSRNSELAEENIVQHNEIERLRLIEQQHDELLQQVSTYGMTAKRPEYYQTRFESVQRQLELANCHLRESEKCVKALEKKLLTQEENAGEEKRWIRAKLRKNSRSAAYWAKFRSIRPGKPAWGVRCACTEPEIAYSLKDQTPRILELEATVAARDLTITRLRARHGNVPKNDTASASDAAKGSVPSMEDSSFREAEIENLRAEKIIVSEELAAKDREIDDLREEKKSADENATTRLSDLSQKLADSRKDLENARKTGAENERKVEQQRAKIGELEAAQQGLKEAIKQKDIEIDDLEHANQEIAEQPAPESPETLRRLKTANTDLDEVRRQLAESKEQSKTQTERLKKANTDLDEVRRQLAESREQSETQTEHLKTAKTDLDELRPQFAECKEQLETQAVRIRDLEAAGRELEATSKLKDDRIASLEEQINEAPNPDFVERQNQSYNEAINKKDQDYRALCDQHQQVLGQQQLAAAQHNEDMQAIGRLQQSETANQQELQRLYAENQNLRNLYATSGGRITDLANQLRQGGNTYTDLQIKYNTQATELDAANQNVGELQSQIANLQQANANLGQTNTSSETDVEKYRLEGEDRARLIWQANFDREMSAKALKLDEQEQLVFKLNNQLQQAKNQATPLREMQLKAREAAVKLREDALLKHGTTEDAMMDHDQQASSKAGADPDPEIKTLEAKLAASNKEAGDAKLRNRGIQNQLNKERKERKEEKERHERELKREQEDAKTRGDVLRLRLEKENPLKGAVGQLQNEVARLKKEIEEQRTGGNGGQ